MGKNYILAIDQGTTSTRTIIFDQKLQPLATAQEEFAQHFPHSGWVEHDPEDLWSTTAAMCRQAIEREHIDAADIAAIGITNQRETTVVWNRHTGRAIYNAIVWQDRRTADYCRKLREAGHESEVTNKTGLLLDPYFSATKLNWILENVDGARAAAGLVAAHVRTTGREDAEARVAEASRAGAGRHGPRDERQLLQQLCALWQVSGGEEALAAVRGAGAD